MQNFDPVENKRKRVENLLALEQTATDMSSAGEDPAKVIDFVNQGTKAVAANFPDIPQYEKAISAVGRYKQKRATDNPQEVIESMPFS